jgi:serine/threonine protein kinase
MSQGVLFSSRSNYEDYHTDNVQNSDVEHFYQTNESLEDNKIVENEELLGNGGYGKIYKSKKNIKISIAIKRMKNDVNDFKEKFKTETKYLNILKKSKVRNNVVHLYYSEEDEKQKKYNLYLELCEGNLKDFKKKIKAKYNNKFPLKIIQDIMIQINRVLLYLIKTLTVSHFF